MGSTSTCSAAATRSIYGDFTLPELEVKIKGFARELGLEAAFFQSNSEGEFVEHLHRLPEIADAAIVNAGAWTPLLLGDPRRARARRRPDRRGPHLRHHRSARSGGRTSVFEDWTWSSAGSTARAPTATARRWS